MASIMELENKVRDCQRRAEYLYAQKMEAGNDYHTYALEQEYFQQYMQVVREEEGYRRQILSIDPNWRGI